MNNNCMPTHLRDCPHCKQKDSLAYYRENGNLVDLYYCQKCFGIVEWVDSTKTPISGEAFPNRKKN